LETEAFPARQNTGLTNLRSRQQAFSRISVSPQAPSRQGDPDAIAAALTCTIEAAR